MVDRPIFICGLFRTGSTFLKNIIDKNTKVSILLDELHIWNPYPFYRDLIDICGIYDLSNKRELDNFIEDLFSDKQAGSFWHKIGNDFKEEVKNDFHKNEMSSPKNIIDVILENYRKMEGKSRVGIKHPVYIGNLDLLIDWFPDCKIIYLVRDPRAIYISKFSNPNINIYDRIENQHSSFSSLLDLSLIFRIIFEYNWSWVEFKKYKEKDNVYLLKYEDILFKPEEFLENICNFLEIPHEKEMLQVGGKPSSIDGETQTGIDPKRAYRWKKIIKNWEKALIDNFTLKSMKEFGYDR